MLKLIRCLSMDLHLNEQQLLRNIFHNEHRRPLINPTKFSQHSSIPFHPTRRMVVMDVGQKSLRTITPLPCPLLKNGAESPINQRLLLTSPPRKVDSS